MRGKPLIFVNLFLIIVGLVGLLIFKQFNHTFKNLNSKILHQNIIEQRDYGIQLAVENGDYQCCITPPCTMCYMEGNQWNNQTAGTCACDQLIAQGKEACPQCQNGNCGLETEGTCNFK